MINILANSDRALAAYLRGQIPDTATGIYPFKRSEGKALPCIIIHSSRATPLVPFDGTSEVSVAIYIRTSAPLDVGVIESEMVDASDALVGQVLDALHKFGDGASSGAGLADQINEASSGTIPAFNCQHVELESIESNVEWGRQSEAWTDVVNLRLVVSNSVES